MQMTSVLLGNNEHLNYRELGKGEKTLLLVHGNMNSSVNWDLFMETMDPNEFRMIAVDLRGMGHSSYRQPISSIKELSDDLKLLVDKLELDRFHLMGWSAGGAVSLQFAADYPDLVDKLILLESASIQGYPLPKKNIFGKVKPGEFIKTREELFKKGKAVIKAYEKKNTKLLKWLLNKALYTVKPCPEHKLPLYLEEMMLQRNLVDLNYALVHFNISHQSNGVVDGNGLVANIKAPTLVLQGELDKVVTMAMAEKNAEAIENASLVVLKGCGHVPLVDDLESLKRQVTEFLES